MPTNPGVSKTYRLAVLTTLASHTLKAAFYTAASALDKDTVGNYTTTGELTGAGYVAGGYALTPTVDSATATPFIDFADTAIPTFTAVDWGFIVIYDVTDANRIIQVIQITTQNFSSKIVTIVWPSPSNSAAAIRLRG